MPINWELARTPDFLGNAFKAYDEGRYKRALTSLADNPDDAKALGIVMAQNPEVGLTFRKAQREDAFNKAAADYYGSNNALLGIGGGSRATAASKAPPESMNALAVPQGFAPALPGPISGYGGGTFNWDGSQATPAQNNAGPDLSALGQPRSQADAAFLRMLKVDAPRALKVRSEMRDNFVKMLGQEREVYAAAVDRLSQATDDASYQRVLQELGPMVSAIGGDLAKHVPANYPGPDGVRELMMKALTVKDRLSQLLAQDRTEAYVDNIEADNARADRNTDSLIEDRNARRGETRRYNDARIATARRGQDMRGSGGGRGLVKVTTIEEARALKPGTRFVDPNGNVRVR
ncbi:hypothetical protein [Novosphingobium sp. NDB2Meth1]|uniref:hypothetical protein n=1 Tax=Novosphingobium sp. NDB2Meth1 TaxID=1892847 RepID=UPI0009300ACB|nr:hypothetical protein [Novosphingobium sp. NDB2Meth1]